MERYLNSLKLSPTTTDGLHKRSNRLLGRRVYRYRRKCASWTGQDIGTAMSHAFKSIFCRLIWTFNANDLNIACGTKQGSKCRVTAIYIFQNGNRMRAVYFKHNKSAYAIHVFQKEQPHNYTRKIISKRFIM